MTERYERSIIAHPTESGGNVVFELKNDVQIKVVDGKETVTITPDASTSRELSPEEVAALPERIRRKIE